MEKLFGQKESKRYRSIKYRSFSSDIKSKKLVHEKCPEIVRASEGPRTSVQAVRLKPKSVFHSEEDFSISMSLKPSTPKKELFQRRGSLIVNHSLGTAANPERNQHKQRQFMKDSQIDTFENLMAIERPKNEHAKLGQHLSKIQSLKQARKMERVSLPNIIEYADSRFTALDPINVPIEEIKTDINNLKQQVSQLPEPLRRIREQMSSFKKVISEDLVKYQNETLREISKLAHGISENSVYEHGRLMKAKRQVAELESFINPFSESIEQAHSRSIGIQKQIFYSHPYELELNQFPDNAVEERLSDTRDCLYF